jgi:cytochrome c oxidase cbb3-type subunit 3
MTRTLGLTLLTLLIASPLLAQEKEASEEQVAEGKALFVGDGGCQMCHGQDAKGLQGMTGDLSDGEWTMAGTGTLEAITEVIKNGLGADKTGGIPMPAQAGKLTEEQITALAAYVLSLGP